MSIIFVACDVVFLRWVWVHFKNWGFWDWDYQQSLLEISRLSWVQYGQAPLWNPFIGGGASLAGNTLNHAWAPCFLPIMVFGTLTGVKVCLFLYALLAQIGMFFLARCQGLNRPAALLAALLYTLGGPYAQRMTHGHFEWIAMAWYPYVLLLLGKNLKGLSGQSIVLGAVCMAFIFLDGGPYQFAFFSVFLVVYVLLQSLRNRSCNPLVAFALILSIGAGLAAVKLLPVLQTVLEFPRMAAENNFYGAPFTVDAFDLLYQAFLSRTQEHRVELWMPYILNVGSYIGLVPAILALVGIASCWRQRWCEMITALLFLWIILGSVLPWTPWDLLSRLPGLSMLRVPSRFNVYVVLLLSLFAALGMQVLAERLRERRRAAVFFLLITAFVGFDLLSVNGRVFKVAFSVPAIAVQQQEDFKNYQTSPFLARYKAGILYETFPNWPSALFPAVLENRGVIENYRTISFPSHAVSFQASGYEGEAKFLEKKGRLDDYTLTPNRITARTNGRAGTLVFNRNYDEGWRLSEASEGKVFSEGGLLAVRLSDGQKRVELLYCPRSFVIGGAVSLVFLFGVCFFFLLRRKIADQFVR